MGKDKNDFSQVDDKRIPANPTSNDPDFSVMANADGRVVGQDIDPETRRNARHF